MRLFVLSIIMILTAVIAGCISENDILVSFKGGSITRGEFYQWISSSKKNIDNVLSREKLQKRKLKQFASLRIAAMKAREAGFDKTEKFKIKADAVKAKSLTGAIVEKVMWEKEYLKYALKVRHIFFQVGSYIIKKEKKVIMTKIEEEKAIEQVRKKTNEIIEKLNKGENFSVLAKWYSEDTKSSGNGGLVNDLLLENMMPVEYAEAAYKLIGDDHSEAPVYIEKSMPRFKRGFYIIKVEERMRLDLNNIDDKINKKRQVKRYKDYIYNNARSKILKKALKESNIFFDKNALRKNNRSEIVFKIEDKEYTSGDVDTRIKIVQAEQEPSYINTHDKEFNDIAYTWFMSEVIKLYAERNGIYKDKEVMAPVNLAMELLLGKEYLKYLEKKSTNVTEVELRDEYNRTKKTKFPMKKGNHLVGRPYEDVKIKIEKTLRNRKAREFVTNWNDKLNSEYDLILHESRLEGDKVKVEYRILNKEL